MKNEQTTVQQLLLQVANILGIIAGIALIVIAVPNSAKGIAMLVAGLVVAGVNIFWLLKRRKNERVALAHRQGLQDGD
jgi:LPXTG-motif cell wall-anchored protein